MKTIVIGGGIGGVTAAIALRQRGLDAQVYEAADVLAPVGKGIGVPLNALLVLDRLGVGAEVSDRGVVIDRAEIFDQAAGLLQSIELSGLHHRWGRGSIAIQRSALQAALLGALPADAIHLGKRLRTITQSAHGVTAQFDDGTIVSGDVLAGADGIHSAVRAVIAPGATLRPAHQTCYLGIARMSLPESLRHTAREVWGGATRFGFSPVADGLVYWFAPISTDPGEILPDEAAASLHRRYAHFAAPIPDLIAHTPPDEIVRIDLRDLLPLHRWSKGRVVLLGDAAHAMTPNLGQGGAQAIEDAYVLAESLALQPDPSLAFDRYERARRPHVKRIAATSWLLGRMAHTQQPWKRTVRNWALRATPDWVNRRQLASLAKHADPPPIS